LHRLIELIELASRWGAAVERNASPVPNDSAEPIVV
jgi:hypothetical protein